MNTALIATLRNNIGMPLSQDLAIKILMDADRLPTLVTEEEIDNIVPEDYKEFTFAVERMVHVMEEIKPLHRAHWDETEQHSHGLPFNPDYQAFLRYEQAGQYVLFTMRKDGDLLGNCAMYLNKSTHTQTLLATEDTLFILPEARKGWAAIRFVYYIEKSLRQLGAREIKISVKSINKAGRFFEMLGYKHVENGLSKMLES
jgi:N-acetylglutamate synthase-like GNAT family acetyltransferase